MSDNPSPSLGSVPETNSSLFLAMRQITTATSAQQAIDALRAHLLPEADRVSLIAVETEPTGKQMCRIAALWDRADIGLNAEFPLKVHELVESQPLVVIDTIYLDEFLAPLKAYMVDTLQAASFAIFPLLHDNKTIGYLEVVARQTGLTDDSQIRALLMVGWQLGLLMDNLRLADSLERTRLRSGSTSGLLRAIAGAKLQETLGDAVTASVQAALPITHLSVALQRDEQPEVEFVTWYGPELANNTTFNGSLIQQALKSGKAILLDGLNTSAIKAEEGATPSDLQKLIVAPMLTGEDSIGTLNFGFGPGVVLSGEDRRICEEVAAHLAMAYANLRSIDRLRRTLQETTSLYSTSLAMTAAQSLEEIYSTLLEEMAQVSAANRIIMYLAGPDPRDSVDYVEVAAVWKNGQAQSSRGQLRYPLGEAPVLSQFPQSRSNLIFNEIQNDMRLDRDLRGFYAEEKVNALMMIPLSTGAIWLGALLVEAEEEQTFTNEQSRLCRSLADQAALALDSHLLLARREQVINRERALREIIEHIREAKTVDEIMAITSQELGKVTGISADKLKTLDMSDSVRIRLSQDERDFISSVQNQVSLAIDNLTLLETTRDAAEHEQALRDISSALNSTLELNEVLSLILSSLGRVLPHDAANIQVVQGGVTRMISARGYAEHGQNEDALRELRLKVDQVPNLRRMADSRQPLAVPDTHTDPGWVMTPETAWVRSYIGAPIYVEDEIIGFLNLDSAAPNLYNDSHSGRLQAFANQAAIAIRNAQLYQSTRMQAEVMGTVTANLQGAAAVDEVLETAVRTLGTTLGDYDVRLRLVPQTGQLAKAAKRGEEKSE